MNEAAQGRIEHAKAYAAHRTHFLGGAAALQAWLRYQRGRPEEARSEALRAAEINGKPGIVMKVDTCRRLFQHMSPTRGCATRLFHQSLIRPHCNGTGELLRFVHFPTHINFLS